MLVIYLFAYAAALSEANSYKSEMLSLIFHNSFERNKKKKKVEMFDLTFDAI